MKNENFIHCCKCITAIYCDFVKYDEIGRYEKMLLGKTIASFQRGYNLSDDETNVLRKLANLKPKN